MSKADLESLERGRSKSLEQEKVLAEQTSRFKLIQVSRKKRGKRLAELVSSRYKGLEHRTERITKGRRVLNAGETDCANHGRLKSLECGKY